MRGILISAYLSSTHSQALLQKSNAHQTRIPTSVWVTWIDAVPCQPPVSSLSFNRGVYFLHLEPIVYASSLSRVGIFSLDPQIQHLESRVLNPKSRVSSLVS